MHARRPSRTRPSSATGKVTSYAGQANVEAEHDVGVADQMIRRVLVKRAVTIRPGGRRKAAAVAWRTGVHVERRVRWRAHGVGSRRMCSVVVVEQDQSLVGCEVREVFAVERDERHPDADATGSGPGVVLRSGPAPSLGVSGEASPDASDLPVMGDDRTGGDPPVKARPSDLAPGADLRPLGQLADGKRTLARCGRRRYDPVSRRARCLSGDARRHRCRSRHLASWGQLSEASRLARQSARNSSSSSSESHTSARSSAMSRTGRAGRACWSRASSSRTGTASLTGCSLTPRLLRRVVLPSRRRSASGGGTEPL